MAAIKGISFVGVDYALEDASARENSFSGSYADLSNTPSIPTNVSDLTNDADYSTIDDINTLKDTYITPQFSEAKTKLQEIGAKSKDKLDKSYYINKYAVKASTDTIINPVVDDSQEDKTLSVNIKGKTYHDIKSDSSIKFVGHPSLTDYTVTEHSDYLKVSIATNEDVWRYVRVNINLALLKPNTKYTIILEKGTGIPNVSINRTDASDLLVTAKGTFENNMCVLTTVSDFSKVSDQFLYFRVNNATTEVEISGVRILEGDWSSLTFNQFPSSVSGIQSVGDSGEITVKTEGKNLWEPLTTDSQVYQYNPDGSVTVNRKYNGGGRILFDRILEAGDYVISMAHRKIDGYDLNFSPYINGVSMSTYNGTVLNFNISRDVGEPRKLTLTKAVRLTYRVYDVMDENAIPVSVYPMIERGITKTEFEPNKTDTQSIDLVEPLRSLPNGVCDEIIGDKLYRRIGRILSTDSGKYTSWESIGTSYVLINFNCKNGKDYSGMCDKFKTFFTSIYGTSIQGTYIVNGLVKVKVLTSLIGEVTNENVKKWVQNNPFSYYYELVNPTIENITPIELETFRSTTSFSTTDPTPTELAAEYVTDQGRVITNIQLDFAEQITNLQEKIDNLTVSKTSE